MATDTYYPPYQPPVWRPTHLSIGPVVQRASDRPIELRESFALPSTQPPETIFGDSDSEPASAQRLPPEPIDIDDASQQHKRNLNRPTTRCGRRALTHPRFRFTLELRGEFMECVLAGERDGILQVGPLAAISTANRLHTLFISVGLHPASGWTPEKCNGHFDCKKRQKQWQSVEG